MAFCHVLENQLTYQRSEINIGSLFVKFQYFSVAEQGGLKYSIQVSGFLLTKLKHRQYY